MLYSNEKQGTNSFRGKVWKLPSGLWRACNYNGQQCSYKLYNEALTFSKKGKSLNEGSYSFPEATPMEMKKIVADLIGQGYDAKSSGKSVTTSASESIVSRIMVKALTPPHYVRTEGLKRQQTRYRPELNKHEMEMLVQNLKDQGYLASSSGPNLKTDATDKAIEMAEGVVYIMCEDG